MKESEIEQLLVKKVKQQGGMCLKWISTITGVPDRIVILNKNLRFVELKTREGVLSERQKVVFADLERQGFPVTVVRSQSDIENLVQSCS